ncbi:hypothetical protein ABZ778_29460 [Streptomyces bacillaris]|uniref:hypothetical protein n=1 Tax=Streptomyces bacillaris TaxID=68179 RepID=UPI0034607C11
MAERGAAKHVGSGHPGAARRGRADELTNSHMGDPLRRALDGPPRAGRSAALLTPQGVPVRCAPRTERSALSRPRDPARRSAPLPGRALRALEPTPSPPGSAPRSRTVPHRYAAGARRPAKRPPPGTTHMG